MYKSAYEQGYESVLEKLAVSMKWIRKMLGPENLKKFKGPKGKNPSVEAILKHIEMGEKYPLTDMALLTGTARGRSPMGEQLKFGGLEKVGLSPELARNVIGSRVLQIIRRGKSESAMAERLKKLYTKYPRTAITAHQRYHPAAIKPLTPAERATNLPVIEKELAAYSPAALADDLKMREFINPYNLIKRPQNISRYGGSWHPNLEKAQKAMLEETFPPYRFAKKRSVKR